MADVAPTFLVAASAKLGESWRDLPDPLGTIDLPSEIADAIKRSINAKTKTYRYVLPTQLLAKLVEPALDCRSVQMQSGLTKPFDARSLCHAIIVPFDQANDNVLGGSTEPYAY